MSFSVDHHISTSCQYVGSLFFWVSKIWLSNSIAYNSRW